MPSVKKEITGPAKELSVAVTIKGDKKNPGPVECFRSGRDYTGKSSQSKRKKVIALFKDHGFRVSAEGEVTVSFRGSRRSFEKLFRSKLVTDSIEENLGSTVRIQRFYTQSIDEDEVWRHDESLNELIDGAYVQRPHSYMNQRFARERPSPIAPRTHDYSLSTSDIPIILNASKAHRAGYTGRGVKVAMIDSGFAFAHPFFVERGYNVRTVHAPSADKPEEDGIGHGTGECPNLLAVAPDVEFIGIKLEKEGSPQKASLLEGFQTALKHSPQVISVSIAFDLRGKDGKPLKYLPSEQIPLQAEIANAVKKGITVVFSAGNGQIGFPSMMPEVISVGGVFVDPYGGMEASDYASAFTSKVFPKRKVPDLCGLVGRSANGANYLVLPLPPHSLIDRLKAMVDGTEPNSGWGVFSGTSAAAPQVAGACALLLQKNPKLKPSKVLNILKSACRSIKYGTANPSSNPGGQPLSGRSATGSGLIDVAKALGKA